SSRERFSPGASQRSTNGTRITGTPKRTFAMTSDANVGSMRPVPTPTVIVTNTKPVKAPTARYIRFRCGAHGCAKLGSRSDIVVTLLYRTWQYQLLVIAYRSIYRHPQQPRRMEKAMARFPKPAEGSWTQHYPQLGT